MRIRLCFLLILVTVSGCMSTAPIKPISIKTQLPLYPAVVTALQENNIGIKTIDIFNNEYITIWSEGYRDLLLELRFKVKISKKGDLLNISLFDYQSRGSGKDYWKGDIRPIVFSENEFKKKLGDRILQILNNKKLYTEKKKQLQTDLEFNYLVMKDMTDVARNGWINSITDLQFSWVLDLDNFKKSDKKSKNYNYKYKAIFTYTPKKQSLLGSSLEDKIYINLYTNDMKYAQMKKGTELNANGTLKNGSFSTLFDGNFFFELVEK